MAAGAHSEACPVCGEPCTDPPLFHHTAEQAAAHFCPPSRDPSRFRRLRDAIERLWEGEDCKVLRCGACGFAFGVPFVGGDEEFYSILHESHAYPSWRWDYDIAVNNAVKRSTGGRALDVGAGEGLFLKGLDAARWQRYAVEGSETTRALLEKANIRVLRDLQQTALDERGKFELVTMFQVLEHLADFKRYLALARALLRAGGWLVVTVPDCDAMLRQPSLTGEHDMPPNHINKFTPGSLSRAMREAGFTPGEPQYEPRSPSQIQSALHELVRTDARDPNTLAARCYRVRDRRLRAPLLAVAAVFTLPRLVRAVPRLGRGAFGVVAVAS